MKKIAIFVSNYGVRFNVSILNILDLFKDKFEVDFYFKNPKQEDVDFLKRYYLGKTFRLLFFNRKQKIKEFFIKTISKLFKYDSIICIDPHGFVLCKEFLPESSPYYYSMELYVQHNYSTRSYSKKIKETERHMINDIKGLLIQSEEREALFRQDYGLPETIPTMILPITYKEGADPRKSSFLRGKYNIDSSKKIAIHMGSLIEVAGCKEFIRAFAGLSDWVVFMQGNKNPVYECEINKMVEQEEITNTIISEDFYSDMADTYELLKSADIGLCWYKDVSPNFTTAGRSSGKIPLYLKFGLPVITNNYESCISAIEKTGCGVCIDDFDKVPEAVDKIMADYESYSANAVKEYDRTYKFENYAENLLKFLKII